jgi:hypothetical protein
LYHDGRIANERERQQAVARSSLQGEDEGGQAVRRSRWSGWTLHRSLGPSGHEGARQAEAAREQLPEGERLSLRQFLREGLDHEAIKAAIERSLAGGNESARVACVKFLSDLELYRKDGDECPRCAKRSEAAPYAWGKIEQLLSMQIASVVQDEFGLHRNARVREKVRQEDHEGEAPVTAMVRRAVRASRRGSGGRARRPSR